MLSAVIGEDEEPDEDAKRRGAFHYLLRDMCMALLSWSHLFHTTGAKPRLALAGLQAPAERLVRHLVWVAGSGNAAVMKVGGMSQITLWQCSLPSEFYHFSKYPFGNAAYSECYYGNLPPRSCPNRSCTSRVIKQ